MQQVSYENIRKVKAGKKHFDKFNNGKNSLTRRLVTLDRTLLQRKKYKDCYLEHFD